MPFLLFLLLLGADTGRLNQHRVTSRNSPAQEVGAEHLPIPSLVDGLENTADWHGKKRPELLKLWTTMQRSFPAVIAWASTTPDYTMPERWWGEWLASRDCVVLTSWSFIRNYRDGTTDRTGAHEKLYEL